ncbi:MAG: helix-turn-helix transcriptional regulator [Anaerolineae bacterium]
MAKRGSEWQALLRTLAICKRLMAGPATGKEMIQSVLEQVGAEAYPSAPAARQAAFKRDRQRLRHLLGVEWDFLDQKYILKNAGPYFSFSISPQALRALALLSVTFAGQSGAHTEITPLLDFLAQHLPEEQRRRLETLDSGITFEIFQQVDPNGIPRRVWEKVQRATQSKRELEFRYLSPRYTDGRPRCFRVAPLRMVYQWGHWYLFAYVLQREEMHLQSDEEYSRFRLFYIQDDEVLKVLPSVIGRVYRQPPRYEVHYHLLPPLSRGVISQHFEEMRITPLENGRVEVRGVTDDLFEAERILLGYGQYCVVLGGPELKKRIEAAVRGMMENLLAGE